MRQAVRKDSGQAITEYILMLAVAISVVLVFSTGLKKVLFRFWMQITCEVSAACPHCPAPTDIKAAANRVAPGSCR